MKARSREERKHRFRSFLFAAGIFTLIIVYWTAVFFGTEWLYAYFRMQPGEWLKQLINSIGGMLIWGLTMAILGRYFRSHQMRFFEAIINVIRRMSKGDFNVSIENNPYNGPFVELVESINDMAVELGQMEKMRQEFISNVSHEIQSPLTSISGFSRALQSDDISPEDRKHYLEIIEAESRRLSKLSDNLLKLTSLESQQHPFEPEIFRLDKQLRHVILACEPQWQEKELELDVQLSPGSLTGDGELLSQVWTNLIYNAIKFTPAGGTIRVSLDFENENQLAVVHIADSGIGIAEEDQPHIFERFYKADKARQRTQSGSGLGLSIAKKIIEMHNGQVTVQSRIGEGTVFTVKLPVSYDEPAVETA
ncbi:sensor histidine kinase [Paenibacillus hexagrammi]|uniref:histidine kinase n=1 Tax=Paenibacillus hexagrammi TaxID=2908839 RepID=A0ABY3SIC9_9BACL|nr:HAMP domain-containing sensor histidine kinase [Paenibacillus sp. YPD9-1]UJF33484.1 HAMP domain-containing histidine kinase [Paenibacillus sp. YPD9-1]